MQTQLDFWITEKKCQRPGRIDVTHALWRQHRLNCLPDANSLTWGDPPLLIMPNYGKFIQPCSSLCLSFILYTLVSALWFLGVKHMLCRQLIYIVWAFAFLSPSSQLDTKNLRKNTFNSLYFFPVCCTCNSKIWMNFFLIFCTSQQITEERSTIII